MNERIKELIESLGIIPEDEHYQIAELIIKECIAIAKNWEDELESANLIEESNAAGIVAYRIARQFGVN